MKILITGVAGFIGYSYANYLLKKKYRVFGVDNINNYYSIKLKNKRLKNLAKYKNFQFHNIDLKNKRKLNQILKKKFDIVYHFAAQPGVVFSISKPEKYFEENLLAFFNLINLLKLTKTKIFYASSSSVYGDSKKYPVLENFGRKPKNFYGMTKKINEDIAEIYSKNFNTKIIGLRFFTVFGEWGRPDMLILKFFKTALKKQVFKMNNSGNYFRDFTYIEDVNKSLYALMLKEKFKKHSIYNICSGKPQRVSKAISLMSSLVDYKKIKMNKHNKIEVFKTFGDNKKILKLLGKYSFTSFEAGLRKTFYWFKEYNKLF